MKGEFENRLRGVMDEVKASPTPVVLFIDEAHTMIGAGGQAGQGDAANLLKPALARGELRTIAATTWAEYKKYFEKDAALTRRFQVVKVEEPSAEQAVRIIHEAGGVAVVAHPYWDVSEPEQVRDLVESLVREVGLDGIETFYPPHTAEQTRHCLELCEEFDLVPTASSDFHGPTHKTFSRWGAYNTYGLGEPVVPPRP